MNRAEESVIRTLSYFAVFTYPLTKRELEQSLWEYKGDISEALTSLEEQGTVISQDGFYCLGKQPIGEWIAIRERRWWYSKQRLSFAQKAARKLRYVPFLKAVYVCNQLPVTAHETSDIDVYIITEKNRIWLVRFFATILLNIFRMRQHGGNMAKHICLSFYASEEALDLRPIRIDVPDIYLLYWVQQLIPVFDPHNFYKKLQEENAWVKNYLPSFRRTEPVDQYLIAPNRLSRMVQGFFRIAWKGAYGDFVNQQTKGIQEQKLKRYFAKKHVDKEGDIVISDQMLKFHEHDRRATFQTQWQSFCGRYVS